MSSEGAPSQAQAVLPMSSEGAPSQAQVPPNLPPTPHVPLQHPLPPVAPIGMQNVPVPAGESGHLLCGPLVPQNDEDRLLSGQQPAVVMYNRMIQKFALHVKLILTMISCVHPTIWLLGQRPEDGEFLTAKRFTAKLKQMHITALIT